MEEAKTKSKCIQIIITFFAFMIVFAGVTFVSTSTADAVTKPARPTIKNLEAYDSHTIFFEVKKVKKAKGYQYKVATNKSFSKSKTITNKVVTKRQLKNHYGLMGAIGVCKPYKKYYVKVRAYKKSGSKKIYGRWSKIAKIRTPNYVALSKCNHRGHQWDNLIANPKDYLPFYYCSFCHSGLMFLTYDDYYYSHRGIVGHRAELIADESDLENLLSGHLSSTLWLRYCFKCGHSCR